MADARAKMTASMPCFSLGRLLGRRAARRVEHSQYPERLGPGVLQAVRLVGRQVDRRARPDLGLLTIQVNHAPPGQHVHHLVVGVLVLRRPSRRDQPGELRDGQSRAQQSPELPVPGPLHHAVLEPDRVQPRILPALSPHGDRQHLQLPARRHPIPPPRLPPHRPPPPPARAPAPPAAPPPPPGAAPPLAPASSPPAPPITYQASPWRAAVPVSA